MKKLFIVLLVLTCLPALTLAGEYQLKPDLKVVLPEVSEPWQVLTEPTPQMLEHMIEHEIEEAAEQGKTLTKEQARKTALKKASLNDLYVVNADSGAHLLISVSSIDEGEKPPSAKTVARSAQIAIDGVEDEGWTVSSAKKADITIAGAQAAQWFVVDYTHDGDASLFLGVVGFANPYWFWLYGKDHLEDPNDRDVLELLIKNIEFQTKSG